MTLIESFSLGSHFIALVSINGYPVVVSKDEHEVRWLTALSLLQATDIYGTCIQKVMEGERKN